MALKKSKTTLQARIKKFEEVCMRSHEINLGIRIEPIKYEYKSRLYALIITLNPEQYLYYNLTEWYREISWEYFKLCNSFKSKAKNYFELNVLKVVISCPVSLSTCMKIHPYIIVKAYNNIAHEKNEQYNEEDFLFATPLPIDGNAFTGNIYSAMRFSHPEKASNFMKSDTKLFAGCTVLHINDFKKK